jgi:MFS family permease
MSYRQLIRRPNVLPLLSATCLSRLASRMFGIVIVFHALAEFGSPSLAGWIAFAAMAPGLMVSPLAGAFLDRAGAARGIIVDLAVSAGLVVVLAACVWLGWADPPVMISLAVVFALTSPLSAAGVRVLLPRLVPHEVLDRANALDTAIHAIVDVIGPSLAGALVGFAGSITAFAVIAILYAAATMCIALVRQIAPSRPSRAFLSQAVDALAYVFRNRLLRGLAIGYALSNFTWGVLVVAVPVFAAGRLGSGTWESVAGLLWAGVGIASGIGALAAGQSRLLGREKQVMTWCMIATALAVSPVAPTFGIGGLAIGLALAGLLAGPIDVALLTLRQRRTEPGRLGRVLAVSMSVNTAGFPIGTGLGGMLVAWSLPSAFIAAALASLLGAVTTHALVPDDDEDAAS